MLCWGNFQEGRSFWYFFGQSHDKCPGQEKREPSQLNPDGDSLALFFAHVVFRWLWFLSREIGTGVLFL